MRTAILALEDGAVFCGQSCGAEGEAGGELVFNTSMTGYQEVLTDPSYAGQLVVMTYPLIGNYGITAQDYESKKPFLEGFIVRELCRYPSNWQSTQTLDSFLKNHSIPAIEGLDTRALTRHLREKGALRAVLSTKDFDKRRLIARARKIPSMVGADLASKVTCGKPYPWSEGLPDEAPWTMDFSRKAHVVVMDFGVKYGILRSLVTLGCRVTVAPAQSSAEEVLSLKPDGIVLSNGPGDPEPLSYAINTIRRLLDSGIPIFGICLGHQLLALALGGRTFKLKFGHHGANHPVKDFDTGKIHITTQNHGFCVDLKSLPNPVRATHINLNDHTCEGMAHAQLPVFSVQYHPEGSAGPHDSRYLFARFGELIRRYIDGKSEASTPSAGGRDRDA